jgi:hypothetical protein
MFFRDTGCPPPALLVIVIAINGILSFPSIVGSRTAGSVEERSYWDCTLLMKRTGNRRGGTVSL